jgi:hypothetical protein
VDLFFFSGHFDVSESRFGRVQFLSNLTLCIKDNRSTINSLEKWGYSNLKIIVIYINVGTNIYNLEKWIKCCK